MAIEETLNYNNNNSKQFPYSVKYEETSNGVRVHVHIYDDDPDGAVETINKMYKKIKENKEITFAPFK